MSDGVKTAKDLQWQCTCGEWVDWALQSHHHVNGPALVHGGGFLIAIQRVSDTSPVRFKETYDG